jgi:hypothetical protein
LNAYSGLVPMSPNTTPNAVRVSIRTGERAPADEGIEMQLRLIIAA